MKTNAFYSAFLKFVVSVLLLNQIAHADAVFDPVSQPIVAIAPYVLKDTNLKAGNTKAYRPWFEMEKWQGDIIQYGVTSSGALSTDVIIASDGSVSSPGTNWSAREKMMTADLADKDYWKNSRKIITSITGTDQSVFKWSELTTAQKLEIDPADNEKERIIEFLRGSRKEEDSKFRVRAGILGDITNSAPVYVGTPSTGYNTLPGYVAFQNTNIARAGRVYVGANDGMIHAFDESTGSEIYAYIPSMLFPRLGSLSAHNYTHKDYHTGELVAADAQIGSTWKTILAGGLGAGGKGLFALDITNPNLSNETSNTGSDKKVLWEKHGTDNDLGHIYGQSTVALLPNGKWYVINGNGYGSANGDAVLYLVEVGTGTKISISTVGTQGNGLSSPTLVDTDFDSVADTAYAGDLQGNLWKFDLSDLTQSGTLLFSAGTSKPITVQPEVAKHPNQGYMVYFGTGSALSETDRLNTDQQSIYAIWDKGIQVSDSCATLVCQTFSADITSGTAIVTTLTNNQPNWTTHKGWKVDLPHSGERLLGHPQLRDGRLQFVTHNPIGELNESWLVELAYLSGGDSGKVIFDISNNGSLGIEDKVSGVSPSGLYLGKGIFSQPAIARVDNGIDTLFINGYLTEYGESTFCSGDCANGLAGGHFDLDVDATLGGSTDKHTHEYDNKFDVTYGDYFNVLNGAPSVSSPGIGINAGSQKLLAFIANADLSIGGQIIIGNKIWKAVEYQKMIQKQLMAWDGSSDLLDEFGDPLAFTLDEINQAVGGTGTLRLNFINTALLTGGLIPTQAGCVKSAPNITNGHWRNGALTLHIVDYEAVKQNVLNNTPAASRVYSLQNLTDLPTSITLDTGSVVMKEDTNGDGIIDAEYGGIIANPANDSAFLYESTLFWHYKGACYGEGSWAQDRDDATITQAELDAFLALHTTLISDIQNYSCTEFKKGECQDTAYQNLISSLEAAVVNDFGSTVSDINNFVFSIAELFTNGQEKTISAGVPEDKGIAITPTPGPYFRWGRQTWIDL
jgi:hypothetical protein